MKDKRKFQSNSMFNNLHTIHIDEKDTLYNSINNRLFMGGSLVCTVQTTSKYMLQSAPWRRTIETCLRTLLTVCDIKTYPEDNIKVQSRQITYCHIGKSITMEEIPFKKIKWI